jgi:putative DNA primase/helicase
VVKTVTGGERVVARRLFEGQFEFDPTFKLTLSANEKPRITGQDEGIWRRVILVPFDAFFARDKRNRKLLGTLMKELPGVLNWLLDGYRLWRERGLVIPDVVVAATDRYRAESDAVGEYLRVCTASAEHARLRAKDLYDVYSSWCRRNAVDPISNNAFGRRLSDRGIQKETIQVVYYALEFTEEGNRLFEELRRRSSRDGGEGAADGSIDGKGEE